jgi:hypothetical protein
MISQVSNLCLQLKYVDDRILVICAGSSGETFDWVDTSETTRLFQKTIFLHRICDAFVTREQMGMLTLHQRNRFSKYLKLLGSFIYEVLFKRRTSDLLNVAIGQAIRLQTNVKITLMIASEFLNAVPWELLHHNGTFIAHIYDVVRHPFTLQPARRSAPAGKEVRLLFISANPRNNILVKDQVESVVKAIKERKKIANKKTGPDFKVSMCEDATVAKIADHIFDGADLIHFLAHGEYSGGQAYFLVETEDSGKEDRLTVEMLQSFCRAGPMQLAVLNSCRSDQAFSYSSIKPDTLPHTEYFSMAHTLIQTGFPCVIGMSHPISKKGAALMTSRLYQVMITQRSDVRTAMRQVRLELFAYMDALLPSDWFSPILYSRAENATIFPQDVGMDDSNAPR